MKIITPNLSAIKFIGNFDKKLFEIGGRELPILKNSDVVIVTKLQAQLLLRQPHFEAVDINKVFVNENKQELETSETDTLEATENSEIVDIGNDINNDEFIEDDDIEQDTYTLPYLEDLEELDKDAVKLACQHLDITTGNYGVEKLKSFLEPHLKSKDA